MMLRNQWSGPRLAALLLALALATLFIPARGAAAAHLGPVISSVKLDRTAMSSGEKTRLDFTWAVPDAATAGDTFDIQLPAELQPTNTTSFDLVDPSGAVIATGVWSGKQATFTLTDYADTHQNVNGTGWFTVEWDRSVVSGGAQPYTLHFGGSANADVPLEFTGDGPAGTAQAFSKTGAWLDPGQGQTNPAGALGWTIFVPTGPAAGLPAPVVLTDTPGAGSTLECTSVAGFTRTFDGSGNPVDTPLATSRYQVSCTPTGMTVTLVGNYPGEPAVYADESIYFTVSGTVAPGSNGVYTNDVTLRVGSDSETQSATIKRDAAGGDGIGDISVTVGDLVWIDENRDGLQTAGEPGIPGVVLIVTGPDGRPVTDINGAPVGPQTTDVNGSYIFTGLPALPPGQHYTVTIDKDASAAALTGLSPTAPGIGGDRAVDSSTWTAESTDLTHLGDKDLTLDFGFVKEVVPTPSPTPLPTPSPTPSRTPSPSASPTTTPNPTPTRTPSTSPTPKPSPSVTPVPSPTPVSSVAPTPTEAPSPAPAPVRTPAEQSKDSSGGLASTGW